MILDCIQAAFQSNRTQLDGPVTCYPLGHALLVAGPVNNETSSADVACTNGSITLSHSGGEWFMLLTVTLTAALVVLVVGAGLCYFRHSLRPLIFSRCGVRLCSDRHNDADDDDKLFDALVIYSAKDDVFLKDTLRKLEQKTYQLCLQHRTEDHDLASAASASRRIIVLLTKSFVETEWGKAHIRSLFRSTWTQGSRHRRRVVILLPEVQLVHEIDADLDLHLLLKHGRLIEWNGRFRWSRLLLALPPARGVLAPADCPVPHTPIQEASSAPPPPPFPHPQSMLAKNHHKIIHQTQRQLPTLPETI